MGEWTRSLQGNKAQWDGKLSEQNPMSSIILELQDEALDREVRISDLLRKALLVARKLSLLDFHEWVEKELQGYPEGSQDIPDYRGVVGQVRAWNPYQGWKPVVFKDPELGEQLSRRKIAASIAGLEHSVEGEGQLSMPFSQKIQRSLCNSFGYETEVELFIEQSSVIGIIDIVRTIILNWALKLEEEGIHGEGLSFSQKEKEAASNTPQNINYFFGTVVSPQIQQGVEHGFQVSGDINIGEIGEFIERFKAALPELNLGEEQKNEAEAELKTVEAQVKSPKPKHFIIREGLKSLRSILEGAAGGAIAAELLKVIPHIPF
jgi:hypothetical protein